MSYTTITQSVVAPAVTALSISSTATVAVNAALGNDFRLSLSKTASIANPTGAVDGQRITFQLTQGGTGGFKVTWGSQYKFGAGGTPVLTTAAGATDVLGFIYNAALAQWLCVGTALGF